MKNIVAGIFLLLTVNVSAQDQIKVNHSLDDVIGLAMENSIDAIVA